MIIKKAFKYRLKTNKEIESKLKIYAGHTRFVWNYFYHINKSRLEGKVPILRYFEMCKYLTLMKKSNEYGFLKEAPSDVLQQKLKDLDKAYRDGFDKSQVVKRMPRARKKELHNSFRFPANIKIENKRVFIPKIGYISFFKSRDIIGKAKNMTVSFHSGKWYFSVQTEILKDFSRHKSSSAVAIDMGVSKFLTSCSNNGEEKLYNFESPFKKNKNKLAILQIKLSKKKRFSKNYIKLLKKISKLHSKISNIRKDFQHKLSNNLSKNHAVIIMEDLKISNMTKSAKGNVEKPGKNVKAKSGLNRSILDQGWYEFQRQLDYKSFWRGGYILKVPPHKTSQKCSNCSFTSKENRLSQAKFKCKKCNFELNADINASRNILAAGLCRDSLP